MDQLIICLRHIRVFGYYAFPEVVITLFVAHLITRRLTKTTYFSSYPKCYACSLLWLMTTAIYLHVLFNVNTQLNYQLGLSCSPNFNSLDGRFPCNYQQLLIDTPIYINVFKIQMLYGCFLPYLVSTLALWSLIISPTLAFNLLF